MTTDDQAVPADTSTPPATPAGDSDGQALSDLASTMTPVDTTSPTADQNAGSISGGNGDRIELNLNQNTPPEPVSGVIKK